MNKWTKEKYLDVINNSPLFDIEDKTSDEYETEKRYLLNKVTEYYYTFYAWIKPYSLEIMEKFIECVKYYKKGHGAFSTYLDYAVNKAIKQTKGKEAWSDVRGGIKIEKSIQKDIRNIVSIAKNKGWDLDDSDTIEKLVQATGKTESQITELIEINRDAVSLSECVKVEEDELSLFDSVADNERTAEQVVIEKDNLLILFDKVDKATMTISPSKLQVISAVLTLIIEELDLVQLIGLSKLTKYSFFNQKVYQLQEKQEKKITDVDIAQMLGKTKPYICKVKKQVFAQMGGI